MLYTFRYSPYNADLKALLRYMRPEDCLLLTEDGVLAGLKETASLGALLSSAGAVFALQEDIEARGLTAQFAAEIPRISYAGFVKLTVEHPQHIAW